MSMHLHPGVAATPLDRVIADYGAWHVMAAAARTLIRRGGAPRSARPTVHAGLTAHLRRDIGLPPADPSPARHGFGAPL